MNGKGTSRGGPLDWFLGDDGLLRPVWRMLLFILLGFVLLVLVQGVAFTLAGHLADLYGLVVFRALLVGAFLLLSWWLLSLVDRRSFRTLGLWFYDGWAREFAIGAGLGLAIITAVAGVLAAAGAVRYTGVSAALRPSASAQAGAAELGWSFLVVGTLFLVAAAWEEIVFRGYPFQRLVDSAGAPAAVAVFAVLFGVVHVNNPAATALSTANTVLAGVLLAACYLKTRALWLPLGLHWAWNFSMGALFSLPVSGLRLGTPLLEAELSGPRWLSGGHYGPEGSVVLTVAAAGALAAVWRARWLATSAPMNAILKKHEPMPPSGVE